MVVFTYTLLVNDPGLPQYPEVRADQLWDSLVHKAANPVSYVPSISWAEVLEEFDGGSYGVSRCGATARCCCGSG